MTTGTWEFPVLNLGKSQANQNELVSYVGITKDQQKKGTWHVKKPKEGFDLYLGDFIE